MAKITIVIEGIAINYHKNEVWKVLFPFDECHTVKFKSDCDHEPEVSLAGCKQVSIKTSGKTASKFKVGDNYNKFFDMTAEYSHKDGIKMKDGWQDKSVLLSIENAEYSVNEMTKSRYQLTKEGHMVKDLDYIGYSGRVEIDSDEVIVEIEGMKGFPRSFTKDCKIFFCNDCHKEKDAPSTENYRDSTDLNMLYNLLEDKAAPGETFTIERDPRDRPKILGQKHTEDTNLPAGIEGLPCHEVRASQSDTLP